MPSSNKYTYRNTSSKIFEEEPTQIIFQDNDKNYQGLTMCNDSCSIDMSRYEVIRKNFEDVNIYVDSSDIDDKKLVIDFDISTDQVDINKKKLKLKCNKNNTAVNCMVFGDKEYFLKQIIIKKSTRFLNYNEYPLELNLIHQNMEHKKNFLIVCVMLSPGSDDFLNGTINNVFFDTILANEKIMDAITASSENTAFGEFLKKGAMGSVATTSFKVGDLLPDFSNEKNINFTSYDFENKFNGKTKMLILNKVCRISCDMLSKFANKVLGITDEKYKDTDWYRYCDKKDKSAIPKAVSYDITKKNKTKIFQSTIPIVEEFDMMDNGGDSSKGGEDGGMGAKSNDNDNDVEGESLPDYLDSVNNYLFLGFNFIIFIYSILNLYFIHKVRDIIRRLVREKGKRKHLKVIINVFGIVFFVYGCFLFFSQNMNINLNIRTHEIIYGLLLVLYIVLNNWYFYNITKQITEFPEISTKYRINILAGFISVSIIVCIFLELFVNIKFNFKYIITGLTIFSLLLSGIKIMMMYGNLQAFINETLKDKREQKITEAKHELEPEPESKSENIPRPRANTTYNIEGLPEGVEENIEAQEAQEKKEEQLDPFLKIDFVKNSSHTILKKLLGQEKYDDIIENAPKGSSNTGKLVTSANILSNLSKSQLKKLQTIFDTKYADNKWRSEFNNNPGRTLLDTIKMYGFHIDWSKYSKNDAKKMKNLRNINPGFLFFSGDDLKLKINGELVRSGESYITKNQNLKNKRRRVQKKINAKTLEQANSQATINTTLYKKRYPINEERNQT